MVLTKNLAVLVSNHHSRRLQFICTWTVIAARDTNRVESLLDVSFQPEIQAWCEWTLEGRMSQSASKQRSPNYRRLPVLTWPAYCVFFFKCLVRHEEVIASECFFPLLLHTYSAHFYFSVVRLTFQIISSAWNFFDFLSSNCPFSHASLEWKTSEEMHEGVTFESIALNRLIASSHIDRLRVCRKLQICDPYSIRNKYTFWIWITMQQLCWS